MNLKNWLTLTIRTLDFNLVAKQPELVAKLRELTLAPHSGLNYELTRMLDFAKSREVNCKVILAYRFKELVGWGILSREDTDFWFTDIMGFEASQGAMFQVFIAPSHRRQRIASEIYKKALKLLGEETIHVSPWGDASYAFYASFPGVKSKNL